MRVRDIMTTPVAGAGSNTAAMQIFARSANICSGSQLVGKRSLRFPRQE